MAKKKKHPLLLPPLRERRGDIPVLVGQFARSISEINGWRPKTFTPAAIAALERYDWPGNIRQLGNELRRIAIAVGVQRHACRHDTARVEAGVDLLEPGETLNQEGGADEGATGERTGAHWVSRGFGLSDGRRMATHPGPRKSESA